MKRAERYIAILLGPAVWLATSPAHAFTDLEINQTFARLDTDADGQVTRTEYDFNKFEVIYQNTGADPLAGVTYDQTKVSRKFFDEVDRNHDGRLSPIELTEALRFETIAGVGREFFVLEDLRRFMSQIGR